MYNIWSFFLQTIAVSIVAGIILLLKKIFEDKLSPKWQYGIWTLLAIRILVPVNVSSYVVPQLALWIEMLKAYVEEQQTFSAFTTIYEPITLHHVVPLIRNTPQSVTDWLFAFYMVGVVFFLLKYLIAYIRLRILLKRGSQVNSELEAKMLSICDTYGLKACKMIAVKGLSSAFICGVFRPILVIPADCDVDEKVLLHELLHYKHYDILHNVGWCILRSLHWCNPLVHFAVNQIENDMETLCDQRVLELLEGEERREYGHILLSMANQKYSRIPGTTSISNGGNNISKRIAAIVRFKKYPQGMTLVSICIILTMFWPTIVGSAATYDSLDYLYFNDPIEKSMAIARINRCGTVAGAIDMYAKGVYQMNGAYVATASPYSEHERIANELKEYGCYQPGKYVGNIEQLYNWYVYNLDEQEKDYYTGTLAYHANVTCDEYTPELQDYIDISEEATENSCDAYILVPISIWKEEGSWVVKETGERYIIAVEEYNQRDGIILCGKEYYGKNEAGEVKLVLETKYWCDNMIIQGNFVPLYSTRFDTSPNPNATFCNMEIHKNITYNHLDEIQPKIYIELFIGEEDWRLYHHINSEWNGTANEKTGGGYGQTDVPITELETSYTADLCIDGIQMDTFMLEEVTD